MPSIERRAGRPGPDRPRLKSAPSRRRRLRATTASSLARRPSAVSEPTARRAGAEPAAPSPPPPRRADAPVADTAPRPSHERRRRACRRRSKIAPTSAPIRARRCSAASAASTRSASSELKPLAAAPLEAARAAPARASTFGEVDDEIDAIDAVDLELFPIFEEEAQELLPKLDSQLRDWLREPATAAHAAACMRTLHTLKGGARLAGAMRLGEMAHRLETRIERLTATDAPAAKGEDVEACRRSPTR